MVILFRQVAYMWKYTIPTTDQIFHKDQIVIYFIDKKLTYSLKRNQKVSIMTTNSDDTNRTRVAENNTSKEVLMLIL